MPSRLSEEANQQKSPPQAIYAQTTHSLGASRGQARNHMTTTEADRLLKERGESVLFADGLEEAFIGIGYQCNTPIAIYSYGTAILCLMRQGMSEEEAFEYFSYNIIGSYVGEQTPIFLEDEV